MIAKESYTATAIATGAKTQKGTKRDNMATDLYEDMEKKHKYAAAEIVSEKSSPLLAGNKPLGTSSDQTYPSHEMSSWAKVILHRTSTQAMASDSEQTSHHRCQSVNFWQAASVTVFTKYAPEAGKNVRWLLLRLTALDLTLLLVA
jgi:hypothetical protein